MNKQNPTFPDAGSALREVNRILAERAASSKWMKSAGAINHQTALQRARDILEVAVYVSYYEAPDMPDERGRRVLAGRG